MGKKGNAQIALEYAVARAMLTTLGALPRPLAMAAGSALGRPAYLTAVGLRRTGERNLELAYPEMDMRERRRILRGSFRSRGRQLGIFSRFPRETADSLREVVE